MDNEIMNHSIDMIRRNEQRIAQHVSTLVFRNGQMPTPFEIGSREGVVANATVGEICRRMTSPVYLERMSASGLTELVDTQAEPDARDDSRVVFGRSAAIPCNQRSVAAASAYRQASSLESGGEVRDPC